MATTTTLMTTEQLLAMPDDGIERWLIDGELREGTDVTRRNYKHARVQPKVGHALLKWLDAQPMPRGEVFDGEAGFRLSNDPDCTVGIDVAYVDAAVAKKLGDEDWLVPGAPILAVEILSPSDDHKAVIEKISTYLKYGVKIVWIVDPDLRTITVYRPDARPKLFNVDQVIDAEPHLSGFRMPLIDIFDR